MSNDNGITIGQLTEALNNKFDLPAGVPQDAIDYVVEFKRPTAEDPTWYRKYKSGWLEQGGMAVYVQNNWVTINFLIPFLDTKYTVSVTQAQETTAGSWVNASNIVRKAGNDFIQVSIYSSTGYVDWYACGQGAE